MIYLYILKCKNDYLYTGITYDVSKRFNEHSLGLCPLTRNRKPLEIVYTEKFENRIEAAKREKEIKGWSRIKKNKLINQ